MSRGGKVRIVIATLVSVGVMAAAAPSAQAADATGSCTTSELVSVDLVSVISCSFPVTCSATSACPVAASGTFKGGLAVTGLLGVIFTGNSLQFCNVSAVVNPSCGVSVNFTLSPGSTRTVDCDLFPTSALPLAVVVGASISCKAVPAV